MDDLEMMAGHGGDGGTDLEDMANIRAVERTETACVRRLTRLAVVLVSVVLARTALAQTETPTATLTLTPTPTATVNRQGALAAEDTCSLPTPSPCTNANALAAKLGHHSVFVHVAVATPGATPGAVKLWCRGRDPSRVTADVVLKTFAGADDYVSFDTACDLVWLTHVGPDAVSGWMNTWGGQ